MDGWGRGDYRVRVAGGWGRWSLPYVRLSLRIFYKLLLLLWLGELYLGDKQLPIVIAYYNNLLSSPTLLSFLLLSILYLYFFSVAIALFTSLSTSYPSNFNLTYSFLFSFTFLFTSSISSNILFFLFNNSCFSLYISYIDLGRLSYYFNCMMSYLSYYMSGAIFYKCYFRYCVKN